VKILQKIVWQKHAMAREMCALHIKILKLNGTAAIGLTKEKLKSLQSTVTLIATQRPLLLTRLVLIRDFLKCRRQYAIVNQKQSSLIIANSNKLRK